MACRLPFVVCVVALCSMSTAMAADIPIRIGVLGDDLRNSGNGSIRGAKMAFAGMLAFSSDIHTLGGGSARGLAPTLAFHLDLNECARAFFEHFETCLPGRTQFGSHAGVQAHSLKFLEAADALHSAADAIRTVAEIEPIPTGDPPFGKRTIRAEGRMSHDRCLFELKAQAVSRLERDRLTLLAAIRRNEALRLSTRAAARRSIVDGEMNT